ncbi:uncharacterized protein METZ01_LOCUS96615, partial [marine metagenome]
VSGTGLAKPQDPQTLEGTGTDPVSAHYDQTWNTIENTGLPYSMIEA